MAIVTQNRPRYRFPRSVRIISSDDFGRILRSKEPGSLRLGRDAVSVCVQAHGRTGRVRFGFTVGKHYVPRSVDRALVKRIMREVSRQFLPMIQSDCKNLEIGLEISLRYRQPLKVVAGKCTVTEAKDTVPSSD